MKICRICKEIYAADRLFRDAPLARVYALMPTFTNYCGIIPLTHSESSRNIRHKLVYNNATPRCQTSVVKFFWNVKSPSRPGQPRPFPTRRVFRFRRSRSSEVRSAPRLTSRWLFHQSGCGPVWTLSPDNLPSANAIRTSWDGGAFASEARSQKPSQTHLRSAGLLTRSQTCRVRGGLGGVGASSAPTIPDCHSPQDDRKGPERGRKKGAADVVMNQTSASIWNWRYEAVREHALGTGSLLQAEPLGLAIVVQHGIAEWIRRWPEGISASQCSRVAPVLPPSQPTSDWQRQLTMVLAQMSLPHLYSFSVPQ
jgi:hypothetical protein